MKPKGKNAAALVKAREQLIAAQHAANGALGKGARLAAALAAVGEQLETLSAHFDVCDPQQSARHDQLVGQKLAIERAMADSQAASAAQIDAAQVALADALAEAKSAIRRATMGQVVALTNEVAKAVRPWYASNEAARRVAERSDAVLGFVAFIENLGGDFAVDPASRALAMLDALIAGERLKWQWPQAK